jgi:hypothetical protein
MPTHVVIQWMRSLANPWEKVVPWLMLLVVCSTCGCDEPEAPNDDGGAELSRLNRLYSEYAALNGGTGPPDEATFKQFVSRQPDGQDVDAMFVSDRDDQPYVILYGKKLATSFEQDAPPDVIIYEQTGAGGGRYLGAASGETGAVDEEKFKELVPN